MIKKMQIKLGLKPDGILGPKTARGLMEYFCISTEEKAAHFLGQIHHETAGFKLHTENLNYSEQGLLKTFRKYFTPETAKLYARNPRMIANRVYANRMGNGNEASGDGYNYRGRGALQLTGKNNYEIFANKMRDLRILSNPDLVATEYYFESALFFFNENRLWGLCDSVNIDSITKLSKRINGGTNGLQDRIIQTEKYYNWLCK